jgi:hypothetical protein
MKEKLFNLFLLIEDGIICQIGAVCHEKDGTDEQKTKFLQSQVDSDLPNAKLYPLPKRYIRFTEPSAGIAGSLSYEGFQQLGAAGKQLEVFEEVFKDLGASQNPLVCITAIVNGKPLIEAVETIS